MHFQLPEVTEVKLTHVQHRQEFHGPDMVLAVDLNFEWETSNEKLDLLDPALRPALYWNAAAVAGQEVLPDVLTVLPNLRIPLLNGGKFKYGGTDKFKGYDFGLDYGLGDERSNVEFPDSAVGKYEIETKEGGSVVLRWQVSYAGERITDDALVKLIRHEQKKAFITLKAPAVLVLVKGGKTKAPASDDAQGDLGEGEEETGGEEQSPESALAASVAGEGGSGAAVH